MVVINMRTKSKRLDARGQRIESARCWTKNTSHQGEHVCHFMYAYIKLNNALRHTKTRFNSAFVVTKSTYETL